MPNRSSPNPVSVLRQIVLVDREIDALRDIAIALRDEYDFHITISGAEALNLLRDGAIDTIVVGQTLYSSTGLNVLAEARRHAPHTHRVLLANAVEASSIERGAAAVSPFKVMQRPCTADKLRELLEAPATPTEEPLTLVERVTEATYTQTHTPSDFAHADFEHVVMETAPERPRTALKPNGLNGKDASAANSLPAIVYTDNGEFYQAISLALQDQHQVRLCTQLDRATELAEMGMCPILITDRASNQAELQHIAIPLRAMDGGMITIAAGSPEVGTALRKLLGTDALHGFLPKPISAPLVRLAVESAKRQYLQAKALKQSEPELTATQSLPRVSLQSRSQTQQQKPLHSQTHSKLQAQPSPVPSPAPLYMPSYRNDFVIDGYDDSPWRQAAPKIAIAAVAVLAVLIGGWYGWHYFTRAPDNTTLASNEIKLAQRAFDTGRYSAQDGAAYHYNQALKLTPQDPVAIAGLDHTADRVIEQAEKALMAEQLNVAADAIAAVRAIQPDHKRLPFLASQLDKARQQVATKNEARAAIVASTAPITEAPISNETQRQQSIARWLATGRQRLAQDRLLTPENDNAEHYLRQVERADPSNASAQQGLREIGARLLTQARDALARQQLQLAQRRAEESLRFGADVAVVDRLRQEIDAAAGASTRGNFLRLVLQRTRENRLFEPDRDNAKYFLGQLQQLDPTATETEQATRALALKLIENADLALAQKQMSAATQLLNEARRIGFSGPELTAAEVRARTARTPAPPAPAEKTLTPPKTIKTVPAKFPDDAMRAGVAGWVDVKFYITASGDVTDATSVASNPPGQYAAQFERAAIAAIRQYKFEARELSSTQIQSMTVRVQFKLQ
jgi:periplasmic protein TonB